MTALLEFDFCTRAGVRISRGCLMACRHGRKLQGLGMGADIESALQVDRLDIVPVRTKKENGLKENGFALVAALPGARLTVA